MKSLTYLLFIILLTSCSTYIPTTTVPTGFKKAHDIDVNGNIGFDGINGNLAYTPINHFYVQGAFNINGGKQNQSYNYGLGTYWNFNDISLEGQLSLGEGIFNDVTLAQCSQCLYLASGYYKEINGSVSISFNNTESFSHGFILKGGRIESVLTKVNKEVDFLHLVNKPKIGNQFGGSYFVKKDIPYGLYLFGNTGLNISFSHISYVNLIVRIGVGFRLKK